MLLKKNFWQSLGLVCCSTVCAIVLAECALHLTPMRASLLPRWQSFATQDGRTYYVADKDAGYDLCANFPPTPVYFPEHPFKLWSNELGCFDKPYQGEKDYILLVGDSFTWASAPLEYKFGTVINDYLGYRVLQCGVNGYGTRQELLKIRKIVEKIKTPPRLIIVGYFLGNDFKDDMLFPRSTVLDGYIVDKTRFVDYAHWKIGVVSDAALRQEIRNCVKFGIPQGDPGKVFVRIKRWLRTNSILFTLVSRNRLVRKIAISFGLAHSLQPIFSEEELLRFWYQIDQYPHVQQAWRKHLETLRELKRTAQEYGAQLLIVLIPEKNDTYGFLSIYPENRYSWKKPHQLLGEFFNEKKIAFLDLAPLFLPYTNQTPRAILDGKRDLYWSYDRHMSIKGNRLTGLCIAQYILDRGLLEVSSAQEKKERILRGLESLRREVAQ